MGSLGMQFVTATADDIIFLKNQKKPETATGTQVIKESVKKVKAKTDSVAVFSSWLQKNFPDAYKKLMMDHPELLIPEFALHGLGDTAPVATVNVGDTTPSSDWGKTISSILTPILGVWQQKQLVDINIKRAEQGLPPIDSSGIAPGVNVGVSPALQGQINDIGKMLLIGIFGVGIVFMLSKRRRR